MLTTVHIAQEDSDKKECVTSIFPLHFVLHDQMSNSIFSNGRGSPHPAVLPLKNFNPTPPVLERDFGLRARIVAVAEYRGQGNKHEYRTTSVSQAVHRMPHFHCFSFPLMAEYLLEFGRALMRPQLLQFAFPNFRRLRIIDFHLFDNTLHRDTAGLARLQ